MTKLAARTPPMMNATRLQPDGVTGVRVSGGGGMSTWMFVRRMSWRENTSIMPMGLSNGANPVPDVVFQASRVSCASPASESCALSPATAPLADSGSGTFLPFMVAIDISAVPRAGASARAPTFQSAHATIPHTATFSPVSSCWSDSRGPADSSAPWTVGACTPGRPTPPALSWSVGRAVGDEMSAGIGRSSGPARAPCHAAWERGTHSLRRAA
mmetsp:Transcript_71821/g.120398  ORF Transcript_71821/g.120398 Transcript_71821/m.120398 type:complete len:214 (-) Transcript_71821:222-863(-)